MRNRIKKLFELAKPYLEKNDFGMAHTKRVFDIAKGIFNIPKKLEDLVFTSIILHDIGGSSIKDQYEKGPKIATALLRELNYDENIIQEVCQIIRTHHDHPENPSMAFRILYDSDKLVMFSKEEFPYYNSKLNFKWDDVINSMYSKYSKRLAREMFNIRRGDIH